MKAHDIIRRSPCMLIGVALSGCATDVVSIGEERTSQSLERGSRCSEDPVLQGDVRVQNQAELDALAGCEQIRGNLAIEIFEGTDLSPLGSLRAVVGTLEIGAFPPPLDSTGESLEEILARDAERDASVERMLEIADAGWLGSLHGVESIEQVGALVVTEISAPDLRAFGSLRNVSAHHRGLEAGLLRIASTRELIDLSGLESIAGIRVLTITQNRALESLQGSSLDTALDGLNLIGNARLHDLDPLRSVTNVAGAVTIAGNAVRDLDALANLDNALERVDIENNPELLDATGLNNVSLTGSLTISGNTALRRLPEFSELSAPASLYIQNNPALESITLDPPALTASGGSVPGRDFRSRADVVLITGNDALQSISMPLGHAAATVLAIQDNTSLISVEFGNLERVAELLSIEGNAQLSEVRFGALRSVDTLEVRNNPRLSTAALARVLTFRSTFEGNADTPAP